ncbi:MAG: hypothetical protein ABJF04_21575 [Reichenbachiella sp.]|uniref:hypothetical protein n=1 Tax=Reichenbachiella sp. TaxID=2184521 RepID=UPI003266CC0D
MRNPDGQNPIAFIAKSKKLLTRRLSQAEVKLLDRIALHRPEVLAKSLQFVHDMALYHSDIPISTLEKEMLYDVIELSRALREMESA